MLTAAKGLRDRGHTIYFAGRRNSIFLANCAEAGFPVYPMNIKSDFGPVNIFKLAAFYRRNRIDVVIANFNKDVRLTGIARWLYPRPALLARSGLAILPNNWKYRLTYKRLVDGIITNTRAIKETYLRYQWLEEPFIRVIYNGIDTSVEIKVDREQLRQEFDLPEEGPVITSVGRLTPQKQQELFLEVAQNIHKEWPEAVFIIVGEGELRDNLKRYANELGVLDNLYMVGHQNDVNRFYAYSDIVLLTSEVEGLPNVVMEAMLAGKPVVAFDVGGIRELITSEKTGIIVPPNDIYLMTQRTLELLMRPDLRASIGKAAREYIKEHFSLDKMIRNLEIYLDEIITRRAAGK